MSDLALRRARSDTTARTGVIEPRYSGVAMALHWLTAACVLTVLPLAWVAVSLPDEAGSKERMFTLHKSVGLTILALVVVRIAWRALHPPPPEVHVPRPLALVGRVSHWLIYLIFLVMPVSGYLLSSGEPYPLTYFGIEIPKAPMTDKATRAAEVTHILGQWAVYGLVILHVLATVWHAAIRRDGVLDRMLPRQDV